MLLFPQILAAFEFRNFGHCQFALDPRAGCATIKIGNFSLDLVKFELCVMTRILESGNFVILRGNLTFNIVIQIFFDAGR
jgi:hypothetical protein